MAGTVADITAPLVRSLVGDSDSIPIRFWDGSTLGPPSDSSIVIMSPDAIRRLVLGPGRARAGPGLCIGGNRSRR